jgi:putative ABC transport system permease protein
VGISITTATLSSLAPALTSARVNLVAAINAGARGGVGARQVKLRSGLVVAEISLAALLLVGAALMIRTSIALNGVDAGFASENLLVMRTAFAGSTYTVTDNVADAVRLARERLRAVPGVVDAVAAWSAVPTQAGWSLPFNIPGRVNQGLYTGGGAIAFTSPGYFENLGIRVLRGRTFDERDNASAAPVAVINEALARQYWPDGADPFTDQVLVGGGAVNMNAYGEEPPRRIVGIVSNVRASGLADSPGPVMYVPQAQLPNAFNKLVVSDAPMAWIVRTQGYSAALSRLIQEELRLATGLPVTDVQTMNEILSSSISRQNLHTLLMMVFAGSALLLATTGIYGLMAYVVQQRTREIGIRMAVGADPGRVRSMILRQGTVLVALGVTVGVAAAYYAASVLSSVLFEVQARDPAVFAATSLVLILVCLPAIVIPALRAGKVEPLTAARDG